MLQIREEWINFSKNDAGMTTYPYGKNILNVYHVCVTKTNSERLRIHGKSKTTQLLQGIYLAISPRIWVGNDPPPTANLLSPFFRYLKTHTNEQQQTKTPVTSSRIWVTIYKILQLTDIHTNFTASKILSSKSQSNLPLLL